MQWQMPLEGKQRKLLEAFVLHETKKGMIHETPVHEWTRYLLEIVYLPED